MLPFFHSVEELITRLRTKSGFHVEEKPLAITTVVVIFVALALLPTMSGTALSMVLFLSPLWLSVLTTIAAWNTWIIFRRSDFIASQKYMLLEIKPPRSYEKTPLAMEAVIAGLHLGPGESNWYKKFIQGAVRPYWSLELASFEGQVHFFIWTRSVFRRIIETQVYAQYPGAQVVEAPDYTRLISATVDEWEIFGTDYKHGNADPKPIKTYVDYGLDKTQKESEQVDPLSNVIEFLASFGKGEYFWLQYVIRVHKGEKYHGKYKNWIDEGKALIKEIRQSALQPSTYTDPITGKKVLSEGFPNPTKPQLELIAAIDRNTSKPGFDVGIRGIYLAKPGYFNGSVPAGMNGLFKAFNSETYNSIGWNSARWLIKFEDYPWEWNVAKRKNKERREVVEAFRRRQFFHAPFDFHDYMVMSTEELATIYHIPSQAIGTPALPRISSATQEAPANLPT